MAWLKTSATTINDMTITLYCTWEEFSIVWQESLRINHKKIKMAQDFEGKIWIRYERCDTHQYLAQKLLSESVTQIVLYNT